MKALHWFKSYLEERKQVVKVEGSTPHSKDLKWGGGGGGFPRELCRGLYCIVTYLLCTFPLDDTVRAHGLAYHFYADDSQLYCSFKLQDQATSVRAIESCLNDIDAWLLANTLKLNKKKKRKKKEKERTPTY